MVPQDMPILGKGGKFELISDLDNFVFSRNRQKKSGIYREGRGQALL